jgi:uncharacterized protein (DUF1697 family)
MQRYVVLLRGINVGGKNKIPMADLRRCLEQQGMQDVSTYIQSGNVLLRSDSNAHDLGRHIEQALLDSFTLDSELIKVLALTDQQLRAIVEHRPEGFGDHPDRYHCDAVFLMGIGLDEGMAVFDPREGVDAVWPGEGVIYSQRLSAQRTKSRLSKIIGTPAYQSMTIRSWATTTKLLGLLEA